MVTLQEGRITFFHLFTLAILLVVFFNALRFLPHLRDYTALKREMQEAIDQTTLLRDDELTRAVGAVVTDSELVRDVVARARKLNIKLDPRDIEVTRAPGKNKRLQVEYEVTVTFPFRFYRKLTFSPEVVSHH